jgi:hypothetical protein
MQLVEVPDELSPRVREPIFSIALSAHREIHRKGQLPKKKPPLGGFCITENNNQLSGNFLPSL